MDMLRPLKGIVAAAALSMAAAVPLTSDASAAEGGVKAGWLKCEVAGNVSFIFGSSRNITCFYQPDASKRADRYIGTIKKFGIDIGYETAGVIIWGVIAPTNDVGPGALAGDYGGATADVAAGYGVGANALFGGSRNSIVLQPLSVEGIQGLNLAGGIALLSLTAAP
jgi:hypothetical protein